MKRVSSLDQLIARLEECSGSEFHELEEELDLKSEEFSRFQYWRNEGYTRNCVERTSEYELILLCWEKNQYTPIHCHGGEECWVHVLEGEINETRYSQEEDGSLKPIGTESLTASTHTYINDNMGFHSLSNVCGEKAMSLHLYVKPIENCRVFNTDSKQFESVKLKDYSLRGEVLEF